MVKYVREWKDGFEKFEVIYLSFHFRIFSFLEKD